MPSFIQRARSHVEVILYSHARSLCAHLPHFFPVLGVRLLQDGINAQKLKYHTSYQNRLDTKS